MEWVEQFDEIQSSALKEMANIGISHVATAIGEISKEKIDISLPALDAFSKEQLLHTENQNGGIVVAYLTVAAISDLTEILIILSHKDAIQLMNKFINADDLEKVDAENLTLKDQESIFSELSTVIAATYFSAIDSMFNLKTCCGVPKVSFNHTETIDFLRDNICHNEGISINVSFTSDPSSLSGKLLLIPDPKTLGVLFETIGIG
ncbi:MAG: chemotaxis protein CheC [Candidatus Omnitrophica bacterium]|nr:chemotaxis protein CheC [Candidatus Omnitrophota bacterium]